MLLPIHKTMQTKGLRVSCSRPFNEGVDIQVVDTLLFVRSTESLIVFTQQVGRGLRLHPEKSHCVIIDLIGNYRNADLKLSLFDTSNGDKKRKIIEIQPEVP